MEKTVKLQLQLREAQFVTIECDWTETCITTNARIVHVALTEKVSDHNWRSVDSQNYGWVGGVVNGAKSGWGKEHSLECVLCWNLFQSESKWRVFVCESSKWMSEVGEILDEYLDDSYCSKECMHFRKVSTRAPIDNLVNLNRVRNMTFGSADMAYNCDFTSTNKWFLTGEHSSTIFHSLHDLIDILEVLPNEVVNSAILQNCLEDSIIILISRHGAANGYVVNIWNSICWDFRLKDVSYVIMEYGNCVCPSHW